MKKILSITLSLIMMLGVTSCNNWLDVNSNPDSPSNMSTPLEVRLPWIQYFYSYAYANASTRTSAFAHVLTNVSRTNGITVNTRWDQSTSPSTTAYQNWFVGGASNIPDVFKMAEAEGATHYIAACKVIKSMGSVLMVDLHGEMPYFESCNPDIPSPKYDNGDVTYEDCLKELDEAIALFSAPQADGATSFAAGDSWNGGDTQKWIKLAYGLKARWLGNMSKTEKYDPKAILDAIALAPQSNDENIKISHANVQKGATTSFISGDAYGPCVIWDIAAWGRGQRLCSYYVNLLTNFRGSGVEDPRANKLIPSTMHNVELTVDGKIGNFEWYRDRGVNVYGPDKYWTMDRFTAANITQDMAYASKDVVKTYKVSDIEKYYTSVNDFITSFREFFSDKSASVEVSGADVKITYHPGTVYVNSNSAYAIEDVKYVNLRADGLAETDGLAVNDMNCYYTTSAATTRTLGLVIGTGSFYARPDSDTDLITYHEMCFLKSEVLFRQGKKDEAYAAYLEGIRAHFARMNTKLNLWKGAGCDKTTGAVDVSFAYAPMAQTDIDAYMASAAVAQSSADLDMADIMLQKLIAMGISAQNWNDVRRFNYFNDNLGFGVVYEGMQVPAYRTFPNATYATDPDSDLFYPRRYMQCSHETGYNATNCNASVEQYAQYGIENAKDREIYSIPVWWDWTR